VAGFARSELLRFWLTVVGDENMPRERIVYWLAPDAGLVPLARLLNSGTEEERDRGERGAAFLCTSYHENATGGDNAPVRRKAGSGWRTGTTEIASSLRRSAFARHDGYAKCHPAS
jgi:hypothetical protein